MSEAALLIGVDVSEAEGQSTGVGRYTLDLLRSWLAAPPTANDRPGTPSHAPPTEFVLFARERQQLPEFLRNSAEIVSSESQVGVVRFQQLQLPKLLRRRPVDLLFCPAYAVPLASRTPSVVALHDLSFERDPSAFSKKEAWRRRFLARRSANKASAVLTISDFSKAEIMDLYDLDKGNIKRVYPSCDRSLFQAKQPTGTADDEKPTRPYLLSVGTLLNRRNIDVLIKAFGALPRAFDEHELLIVGSNQTRPKKDFQRCAESHGLDGRVRFAEHVSESDLVRLYQQTDLLISLSEYEGFGLPVLEGICCGAPVLALDVGVYSELWKGIVHLVSGLHPETVAQAMARSAGKAQDPTTTAPILLEKFDQQRQAAKVLRFLREVSYHEA